MRHDGQVFLQYDSGVNDKNIFLIFASNQGMDDLVLNKQWAWDGTFNCFPSIFYQLYIIHVRVREIYILSVVHYSCSRNIHSATFCAAPQQSAAHVQLALREIIKTSLSFNS